MSYVETYTRTPLVVANTETIEQQIDRVATGHNIATTSLYNLAMSESSLGDARIGDGGKSCGIVHFHSDYYPMENSRCADDEYILNRAAEMIANGEGWKFTPGNCYAFATAMLGKLPKMAEITPNSDYPRVGGLAIMQYSDKHIGVVTSVTDEGFWIKEANYEPFKITKRLIKWNDSHIRGYWSNVK
jgi:hypothetical protein